MDPFEVANACVSTSVMNAAKHSSSRSRIHEDDGRLETKTRMEYTSAERREETSRSAATSSKKVGRC